MKRKRRILLLLIAAITTVACGCKGKEKQEDGIKTFSAFVSVPGKAIPNDNRIMNRIAEKIGAKADVKWLTGQTAEEKIGTMIKSGKYPDFIDGGDATAALLEADAYIPLEDYIDDYPNIKNYLSESQWNQLRQDDGHIYFIPQFGIIQGEDMKTQHSDEAFWIQKRVLEWAGYPKVKTLDEYFQLIESFLRAYPVNEDGTENTGFQILCDDWRYFCLENPPQFLAGYSNDGCAIVDPETKQASVYDTIPEAKQYYRKLNEMYHKGIVKADTFIMSYDQYLERLSTGGVIGMVDQYWQFMAAQDMLYGKGMADRTYVPLGIVADEGITGKYRAKPGLNKANGLGITVSCEDVEGALQFINDLLDEEILLMRNWGEADIDYEIDENGVFYRTEEQRRMINNHDWQLENLCSYYYFPHYEGQTKDRKNALSPGEQSGEYYAGLLETDQRILDAYGYEKWTDFLNPIEPNQPWFPLYTAENNWAKDSACGIAKLKMEEVKRKWLPQVIMADSFEDAWMSYTEEYEREVDVETYEEELTKEVQRRIELAQKYEDK